MSAQERDGRTMPRKDIYHDVVKKALIRDGWTITHDPYPLKFSEEDLYVDIGAERPLGAEKEGRKAALAVRLLIFDAQQETILRWID
jgi:hypothetical protein